MKDKLVYPFILYCCDYATDYYWRNIFEDLAYGRSPFGTYIYKNTIIYTVKGKEFTYVITDKKTPEENYNNIYNLFSKKIGIKSLKETYIKNKCDDDNLSNYSSWNSIKKKRMKNILIEKFILKKKEEYNLSYDVCRKFVITINLSILFKTLSGKNIEMEEGNINSIDGVTFFKGKGKVPVGRSDLLKSNKGYIIYDDKILENYNSVNIRKSIVSKKGLFNDLSSFMAQYST